MCMQHAWHVERNKELLDCSSGMASPRTCSRRKWWMPGRISDLPELRLAAV